MADEVSDAELQTNLLHALRRVAALVREAPGGMACLTCLAIDAHVPRTVVAEVAHRLVGPSGFRLTTGVCTRCGATGSVLHFDDLPRTTVERRRAA